MAMDPKKPVKTKSPSKTPGAPTVTRGGGTPPPAKRVPPIRTGPGVKVR